MKAQMKQQAAETVYSLPAQGAESDRFGELVNLANEVHAKAIQLEDRIRATVDGLIGSPNSSDPKDPVPRCRQGLCGLVQDSLEHALGTIKEINEVLDRL